MNARFVASRAFVLAGLVACGPTPIDAVEPVGGTSLPTDLVAHWSFDDGSGALAHDDSGNGYQGRVVRGQWVQDGRFGGALRLNRGDYVAVNGFQDSTPDWTVSAWFRHSQGDDLSWWSSLVSNEIFSQGGWLLYTEPQHDNPDFFFEYSILNGNPGNDSGGCCAPKQPGVWYHLTAVVSDRSLTLYLGTEARTTITMRSALMPGDPTLYIGKWSQSDVDVGNPGFFAGVIDDISIFSRALGPDEVARLDREPATGMR